MPTQQPELGRGSLWRKWDLHVHSPASALANEFGGDWDKYIAALAALKDVAVLGITDYFSIEGYRRVLQHRQQLSNIDLILPNIELRLNSIVGENSRRVNYHVIFSDQVSPADIENHFFAQLHFQRDGSPVGGAHEWLISRANLEHLGGELLTENSGFKGSPYTIGCMNATVDPTKVQELLNKKKAIFRGKYLLVLAEEDLSEMQWNGQDHHTRKMLIKSSHAIFTSNDKSIKWYRGEGGIEPEQFRAEFGSLKPCYHGSDAHQLDKIAKPDKNRFCWIKADPTFEGLRQTVFEPAQRVCIGLEVPRFKNDYQVIESVGIQNAPEWFDSQPIPLNKDLVTVVGGKGSGKSALAELIAFVGGSKLFTKPEVGALDGSFLKRASNRSETNPNPLTGARIELRWADGHIDVAEIKDGLLHGKDEEKVKYLPQKFVESLCSAEHTDNLQREIERIIFQNLPEADRARAGDFQELRELTTKGILMRRKNLEQTIRALNASIAQHKSKITLQPARLKELSQKQSELASLQKQPPSLPSELKQELDRVEALTRSKQELEARLATVNETIGHVSELETHIELFSSAIDEYNKRVLTLANHAGLGDQSSLFIVEKPTNAKSAIDGHRQELRRQTDVLREGGPDAVGALTLSGVEKQLLDLQKQLEVVEAKRKEHQTYIDQLTQLENAIKTLTREIQELKEKTEPALDQDLANLEDRFCDSLDLLLEERLLLEELYKPLKASLANGDATAKKLGFHSQILFHGRKASTRFREMLDLRSSLHDQADMESLLGGFSQKITDAVHKDGEKDVFDRALVRAAIKDLLATLAQPPGAEKPKKIDDQLRKVHSREEFDNELFNPQWFGVSYALLFDGKHLQLLSPGERGIVLLLLYLEAEQSDHRPLVIDQPEDNLDNESVYPSLVDYFRKRKHHRQIIIVTHNPNLVVNTDSEQIIVPSFDGGRTPRVAYRSGSLENTSPKDETGIREKVCKVLEGGRDAFRRREEKYDLP